MSLPQSLIGTHIIETAKNFARADDPLQHTTELSTTGALAPLVKDSTLDWEEYFWQAAFQNPSQVRNTTFHFHHMRLSEWVARVPGLAWKPESLRLRDSLKYANKVIGGYAYHPFTRSLQVMGGVGTLRLPPDDDGAQLVTILQGNDVASGLPALMSVDVWDAVKSDGSIEGRVISGKARWVPMSQRWATNFPAIRDIPRGYLLLTDPDAVEVSDERASTHIAPFSIMEYASGSSELFDYVYVIARTEGYYRKQVEDFFNRYHKDVSQHSRYLIAGDMVEPMWDAEFLSPAELRRQDAGAKSQLSLLEARVREHLVGNHIIEPLLEKLGSAVQEADELKVLSDEIQIKPALWLVGGSLAEQISQFLDAAVQHEKLDELIVRLAARHPQWFVDKEGE